eukprot:c43895_g1_i1 orf=330-488(+)
MIHQYCSNYFGPTLAYYRTICLPVAYSVNHHGFLEKATRANAPNAKAYRRPC